MNYRGKMKLAHDHQAGVNKTIILTGPPSAGKTTMTRMLEKFRPIIGEAARDVIREWNDKDKWGKGANFQEDVYKEALKRVREAPQGAVLDRSHIDGLAYGYVPPEPPEPIKNAEVWFMKGRREMYKTDAERKETFEQAQELGEKLKQTYKDLGYSVREIDIMDPNTWPKWVRKSQEPRRKMTNVKPESMTAIAHELLKVARELVSARGEHFMTEEGHQEKVNRLLWAIKSHYDVRFQYKTKAGETRSYTVSPMRVVKDNTLLVCKMGRGSDLFFSIENINPAGSIPELIPYQKDFWWPELGFGLLNGKILFTAGTDFDDKEYTAEIEGVPGKIRLYARIEEPFDPVYVGVDAAGNSARIQHSKLDMRRNKLQNRKTGLVSFGAVWFDLDDLKAQYRAAMKPKIAQMKKEMSVRLEKVRQLIRELQEYPDKEVVKSFVDFNQRVFGLTDERIERQQRGWESVKAKHQETRVARALTAGDYGAWLLPDGNVVPVPGLYEHLEVLRAIFNKLGIKKHATYDEALKMGYVRVLYHPLTLQMYEATSSQKSKMMDIVFDNSERLLNLEIHHRLTILKKSEDIEEIEDRIRAASSKSARLSGYGAWILPDGKIIPVPTRHREQVREILGPNKQDADALREGWVRVAYPGQWPYFDIQLGAVVSSRQKGVLENMIDDLSYTQAREIVCERGNRHLVVKVEDADKVKSWLRAASFHPLAHELRKIARELFSGKSIPSKNRGGDCYQAAANYVIEHAILGQDKHLVLVHGLVTGQGAIEGIQYGHAWVEDGDTVIDVSNGRNLRLPKDLYYTIGHITHTFEYKAEEAQKKLLQTEKYGPWDLKSRY